MSSWRKFRDSFAALMSLGTDQDLLEHRGAILNLKSMDLVYEGEVVNLTKNEFQILRILFEKAGSVVARDD